MTKPLGTILYAISTNNAIVAYAHTRQQVIEALRTRRMLGKDEVFEPKMPARWKPLTFKSDTRTFVIERL